MFQCRENIIFQLLECSKFLNLKILEVNKLLFYVPSEISLQLDILLRSYLTPNTITTITTVPICEKYAI